MEGLPTAPKDHATVGVGSGGAELVVDTSSARRQVALRKVKAYGAALGGCLTGYFLGATVSSMMIGEFAGAELVAPRIRLGRLGWMPAPNLFIVVFAVVGCVAATAAVHQDQLRPVSEWADGAAHVLSGLKGFASARLSVVPTRPAQAADAAQAEHEATPGAPTEEEEEEERR
ncbi:hypothetical protein FNF27_06386 [Cafeteria roenbergensis]|uniref:Uncharacterized protein n=1 Tax=Cafeteria roenbergensis TaxID=33653 RepID=A0A5A8E360_CAFRO|nr:hypothetical protein FNF27_06386 [Cafeteria roenbergensis]